MVTGELVKMIDESIRQALMIAKHEDKEASKEGFGSRMGKFKMAEVAKIYVEI